MARALDTAEGLVTVSSTAAIEAVARGIPVIALDTFGVDDKLINTVFVGSGLLGAEEAVIAREFRHPAPAWLDDNYFHDPAADDWVRADRSAGRAASGRGAAAQTRSRPPRWSGPGRVGTEARPRAQGRLARWDGRVGDHRSPPGAAAADSAAVLPAQAHTGLRLSAGRV